MATVETRYCRSCGTELATEAEVCVECGVNVRTDDVGTPTAYCRDCGEEIKAAAEICPHCGVRQRRAPTTSSDLVSDVERAVKENRALVAAVASFLWPGVGQLVNGEVVKGLVLLVLFPVAAFTIVFGIGFVLAPAVWLYAVYDAYTTGERLQEEYRAREAPPQA
ncbi:double zinc ribbon domain-containing protein [Halomarina pelagica]|uniref:double zinc ribbon domain-containing protein n=1 Tax=Halomarina pelagica TaxID=2961599 RepID=UPI0020C46B2E|nr:zinc ribbon domain-containing protein [Halomarina sp. BND7]